MGPVTVPAHPGAPAGPSEDPRSDRELLGAHVAGDARAFPELVARHRQRLWNLALRTLRSREDAADALQDAFLRALRGAEGFRGDAEVSSWLHRIMVNVCLTRLDSASRRPTVPLDDDVDGERGTDLADAQDSFAEVDARRATERLLGGLPDEQRMAIALVDVQGYSVAEAAEALEVAPGTVKSRCARGRARLAAAVLRERGSVWRGGSSGGGR